MRDIVTARPLRGAYTSAIGDVPWLDDVMTHPDAGDRYWHGASLARAAERLSVSTDTGYADVFTRLCDVDAQGRSTNVCDGLARLETVGQAPSEVTVRMSSTAYRFPAGHRMRWQISGGAHPRYARNPGTGKSPVDAVDFTPTRITLHTGSVLTLPLLPA